MILSFGVKLFFKKTLALCSARATALCEALGMHGLLVAQVDKAIRHCLVQTMLGRDRYVDTLIMCCVYAVGRVYTKNMEAHAYQQHQQEQQHQQQEQQHQQQEDGGGVTPPPQEITFKDIIAEYRKLTSYDTTTWDSFRSVAVAKGQRTNIIEFYNNVFVPEMDHIVGQLQLDLALVRSPLLTVSACE